MDMNNTCEKIYRGKFYDAMNHDQTADIDFWKTMVYKHGDPVLEIACGTGRVTIPLAEKGYRVTGLDITETMLSLARKKASDKGLECDIVRADCRDFDLGKKFRTIIFPFNSIAHLYCLEDVRRFLECVKKHMHEGAVLIIAFFNPRLDLLCRDQDKRYLVQEFMDPYGNGKVIHSENNCYNRKSQINRINWFFEFPETGEELHEILEMRIFFPQELDSILELSGFSIINKYGDFDGSSFETESNHQLIVARAI